MLKASENIRKNKPSHGDPIHLNLEEPKLKVLDNGVNAYCINAGDEDVIRLDIIINAGSAYQDKKLVATSTGKLLKEGTKNMSSSAIAQEIDNKGAYLDISVSKDSSSITLYSLNKHLNELLPIVGKILSEAQFPDEEVNIHIERQKQEFLTNSEKVRYRAMLEFNKMIFGESSAYGQQLQIEDFEKLSRQDIVEFYNQKYFPQNAYIVISGKLNNSSISLVNKYIGNSWSAGQPNKNKDLIFTEQPSPEKIFISKNGALQSAIRVGRPIVSKTHPDYNAFILLNTILGGYFGSRLMSNLREDKGYTYGVSSYLINFIHAGYFSISTEVNATHTNAALDEIYNELEKLRTQKVGEEELHLVKNYIYGTFLRNFDGAFSLAERYRSVKDFGLNFEFYKNSLDAMLKIEADQLFEIANKYLNPDDMIQLVVGKAE